MVNMVEQLDQNRRKVDFQVFDLSVKEIISMVVDSIINIAPDYQRRFRWDPKNQSMFIESVFMGIPIPSIFTAQNPDGDWEVIDGVQRLSTLMHFAGDGRALELIKRPTNLVLTGLEKLTAFNKRRFVDLPNSIQLKFLLKSIRVTTLTDKSNELVRFDLFERLNRGGVILEQQEIRACIFRGQFSKFLREMAGNEHFKQVVRLPQGDEENGTREELVLKFYAYLYKSDKFEHSVKDFLNEFMQEASREFDYHKNRRLFENVFLLLAGVLPNGINRGRFKSTPINLYEAVAVGAAKAYLEYGRLNTEGIEDWLTSDNLRKLTTGATNSRPRLNARINFCYEKLSSRTIKL